MIAHAAAMLGNLTAMEDDLYDAMVADFQAHPKPKKWKYRLYGSNGQHYIAVNYRERFWRSDVGLVWEIIPMREALQMEQDEDVLCNGATPSDVAALYKRGFELHLAGTLTYNHRAKKHPIRVNARPGDPVRG